MINSIELIISIGLEYLIFIYYANSVMYPRKSYAISNVWTTIGYAMLYAISQLYVPIANVIAFSLMNFAVLYLLYDIKVKSAIIQMVILTAIMMLTEGVTALIMNIGIYNSALLEMPVSIGIMHGIFSKLMYFVGIVVAKDISKFLLKDKIKDSTAKGYVYLICIPIFSAMVILGIMSAFENINEWQRALFIVIAVFGIVANIVVYWVYDNMILCYQEMHELQKRAYDNKLELAYCKELEDKLEQARTLRHDFKEHLNVLETYISDNSNEALEYIKSIKTIGEEVNIVRYTNIKVLNILLSEKQKMCAEKQITLTVHAADADLTFMKDIDIVSVFSNLLNNAIESAEVSEKKNIYLNLYKMNKSFAVIKIENSCDKKPLIENGFYKTSKTGGEHGIGLKSVVKSLKEYNADLRLQYNDEDKIFSVVIMIPVV